MKYVALAFLLVMLYQAMSGIAVTAENIMSDRTDAIECAMLNSC